MPEGTDGRIVRPDNAEVNWKKSLLQHLSAAVLHMSIPPSSVRMSMSA